MARVPLVGSVPANPPADDTHRETVEFQSPSDGRRCRFDVYWPVGSEGPLPAVVAPHPIGWTADEEYWGGLAGLVRGFSRGWRGLCGQLTFALIIPHGHHRAVGLCSLGYEAQIDDFPFIVDLVDRRFVSLDSSRIYAAGLSMGAQEALLFAGRYPTLVAATFAFNPIVDLAAWHDDLAASTDEAIRAYRTADRIREEVGGPPPELVKDYERRSPLSVASGLARVPTMLVWSRADFVVPRQAERHAVALYRAVKDVLPDAPIGEFEHTRIHGLDSIGREDAWRLHEWCDYELAATWLLSHTAMEAKRRRDS